MAKNSFTDWSTTAASNTDIGGVNIDEGCAPSGMNNAVREMMAQLKSDVAGLDVANTFTANQTITSTDAGATLGPVLDLTRTSASPAANDVIGGIRWFGVDSGAASEQYARIQVTIADATAGSEDAFYTVSADIAGALTPYMYIGANAAGAATANAVGLPLGRISFPTTQNASTDANTLDDYEEGTWTPSFTFATPGNLSRSFSAQAGNYTKIGNQVTLSFSMTTSAFTHTTASGLLNITGVPFAPKNDAGMFYQGALNWGGVTKAGYTQANVVFASSETTILNVYMSGSGVAAAVVTATDMPTGGTVVLRGTLTYLTAA